jgi:hypothetical protein
MESEKLIYWLTLGVLAMATITGSATGWGDRFAKRSIAMMSRASEKAKSYAEIAGVMWGSSEGEAVHPAQVEVALQNEFQDEAQREFDTHLACVQRVLACHQAEFARLQARRVQVRMLQRAPRTAVWPMQNIVVEVPETPDQP